MKKLLALLVRLMNRLDCIFIVVAMPEWLRGLTRNQMRFPRVGSNPTGDECFCIQLFPFHICYSVNNFVVIKTVCAN